MTDERSQRKTLLIASKFMVEEVPVPTRSGGTKQREVVVHPGSVVILPILADGRVLLIENPRFAVGATLLELPAGTLAPGEDPRACAERELLEETGYRAHALEPLLDFYPAPGFCSERMFCFLATGLEQRVPSREETELMENVALSVEELELHIRDRRVVDAKTIAAFLFWRRFGAG